MTMSVIPGLRQNHLELKASLNFPGKICLDEKDKIKKQVRPRIPATQLLDDRAVQGHDLPGL